VLLAVPEGKRSESKLEVQTKAMSWQNTQYQYAPTKNISPKGIGGA